MQLHSKVQHQASYFFPLPLVQNASPKYFNLCISYLCSTEPVWSLQQRTPLSPRSPLALLARSCSRCNPMAQVQALVPPLIGWATSSESPNHSKRQFFFISGVRMRIIPDLRGGHRPPTGIHFYYQHSVQHILNIQQILLLGVIFLQILPPHLPQTTSSLRTVILFCLFNPKVSTQTSASHGGNAKNFNE